MLMKHTIILTALTLFIAGCGKKEEAAPAKQTAPPMPSLAQPSAPASAPGGGTSVAAPVPGTLAQHSPTDPTVPVADVPVDLDALNKAVEAYCKKTQANPGTLDDLVKQGFLKALPKLPPGKVFAIDDITFKVKIEDIRQ